MNRSKYVLATAITILCAILLAGFSVPKAEAEEDSSGEYLTKVNIETDGRSMEIVLKDLKTEDGNLEITLGMDRIREWKDETPPKMTVVYEEPYQKFAMELFTADLLRSLPEMITSYSTTMKLPVQSEELPDRIQVSTEDEEPVLLWDRKTDSVKKESVPAQENDTEKKDDPTNEGEEMLTRAERLLKAEKYYDAALLIYDCWYEYDELEDECDELWIRIEDALLEKRPETGPVERTIQYEGRNEIRFSAQSGDVLLTCQDVKTKAYVRYYIRQGEQAVVYLPGGEYTMRVDIGTLWFDNVNGFGEFGESVTRDENLKFEYSDDGSWVSYTWYEFTV